MNFPTLDDEPKLVARNNARGGYGTQSIRHNLGAEFENKITKNNRPEFVNCGCVFHLGDKHEEIRSDQDSSEQMI